MKIIAELLLFVFLLKSVNSTYKEYSSPVNIGYFSTDVVLRDLKENLKNHEDLRTKTLSTHQPRDENTSPPLRRTCNFKSDCPKGFACCSNVTGVSMGHCYNITSESCCSEDASITDAGSLASVGGSECCNSSASGVVFSCGKGSACSPTGCTDACQANLDCSNNQKCCRGSNQGSDGSGRCYTKKYICCMDGRICSNQACNISSESVCCSVNFALGVYSYCRKGYNCATNGSAAVCILATGNNTHQSTSAYTSTTSSNITTHKKSSVNTGAIIGVIIAVSLVFFAVLVAIFVYIHWPRRRPKNDPAPDQLVPPNYAIETPQEYSSEEMKKDDLLEMITPSMLGKQPSQPHPEFRHTPSLLTAIPTYGINVGGVPNVIQTEGTNSTISGKSGIPLPPVPYTYESRPLGTAPPYADSISESSYRSPPITATSSESGGSFQPVEQPNDLHRTDSSGYYRFGQLSPLSSRSSFSPSTRHSESFM